MATRETRDRGRDRGQNQGWQGGSGRNWDDERPMRGRDDERMMRGGRDYDDFGVEREDRGQRSMGRDPDQRRDYGQDFGRAGNYGMEERNYGRDVGYGQGRGYQERGHQERGYQASGDWDQDRGQGRSFDRSGGRYEEGRNPGNLDRGYGSTRDFDRMSGGSPSIIEQQGRLGGGWGGTQRLEGRGLHSGKGPKGWKRSDDRLRDQVCELLSDHEEIDASEIEIEVSDQVVTLKGTVDDRWQKRLAEDVVERVPGISDVQNQIRVRGRTERNEGDGSQNQRNTQNRGTTGRTAS